MRAHTAGRLPRCLAPSASEPHCGDVVPPSCHLRASRQPPSTSSSMHRASLSLPQATSHEAQSHKRVTGATAVVALAFPASVATSPSSSRHHLSSSSVSHHRRSLRRKPACSSSPRRPWHQLESPQRWCNHVIELYTPAGVRPIIVTARCSNRWSTAVTGAPPGSSWLWP
jgi:hypothetical protein